MFDFVDIPEKKALYQRLGGGLKTLGGGLLKFPFKNPYSALAGGALLGAGSYLVDDPDVQNYLADIPFYPQNNPITDNFQFSTYDEMRDIQNIPTEEVEMNKFLSEYYPEAFDVLDTREAREAFYNNSVQDIQNVVNPPVVETPVVEPQVKATPNTGMFGDDAKMLMMLAQAGGLFGDRRPATKIMQAEATPGLQLGDSNPYLKELRRGGLFG